jgi:hypothetical protein
VRTKSTSEDREGDLVNVILEPLCTSLSPFGRHAWNATPRICPILKPDRQILGWLPFRVLIIPWVESGVWNSDDLLGWRLITFA